MMLQFARRSLSQIFRAKHAPAGVRSRLQRRNVWRLLSIAAVVVLALIAGVAFGPIAQDGGHEAAAAGPYRWYRISLREPSALVRATDSPAQADAQIRQEQVARVSQLLSRLQAQGEAGRSTFDAESHSFRAELTDAGRAQVALDADVAAVDAQPADSVQPRVAALDGPPPLDGVSSLNMIQVYTPFMWGHVGVGGLSVELTLENADGSLRGVAYQTLDPANTTKSIKIDRTRLYYETGFVEPGNIQKHVTILPGNRVRVKTTGLDRNNNPATDEKVIVVDDVQAWTSYEHDTVSGIAPSGAQVIVTSETGGLRVEDYWAVDAAAVYTETVTSSDGRFSVSSFRSVANSKVATKDLAQSSTGFVRVKHPDGNEVYTVHGQNALVLQNGGQVHGWAFPLPAPPTGIAAGVTVKRPAPWVDVTWRDAQGVVKGTQRVSPLTALWNASFSGPILGGDRVDVSVFGGPTRHIQVTPITAAVDRTAGEVTGIGPANTSMVVGLGYIQGYMQSQTNATFTKNRTTTDDSGNYRSSQFPCSTNKDVRQLDPGSFGFAGYEDSLGNFVYIAFGAPTTQVMVQYPFVEGWVANGTVQPTVTVQGPDGTIKHESTVSPLDLWLANERLFSNTYFQVFTDQFIEPGDTVRAVAGNVSHTISVSPLEAYLNTDTERVVGIAPAGSMMRVIPSNARSTYALATADQDNHFQVGNPFTDVLSDGCGNMPRTIDLQPGDAGRAYLHLADGNALFASYGRSLHVNLNENYMEAYLFPTANLDWDLDKAQTVAATLTRTVEGPVTVSPRSLSNEQGKTTIEFVETTGQRAIIRMGHSLAVRFEEGPGTATPGMAKRTVVLTMGPLALVTGSPDLETSTIAGLGPRGWSGQAKLNPPPDSVPATLSLDDSPAYAPVRFTTRTGNQITLSQGYSGIVSFTSFDAKRLYAAWAATTYPVKITGWPRRGDTEVCGTAVPSAPVQIFEVTTGGQLVQLGSGTVGADGKFCVAIVPPLYEGQIIVAESGGSYSQPVEVDRIFQSMLPLTMS